MVSRYKLQNEIEFLITNTAVIELHLVRNLLCYTLEIEVTS